MSEIGVRTVFQISRDESITLWGNSLESTVDKGSKYGQYRAAIDGMESLLLALHCAGVGLSGDTVLEAVQIAAEAIADNYGD